MVSSRRSIALCAIAVVAACEGGGRPRIGIATNQDFADAAALAVADALAEWGELPADTVIAVESYTRAAIAIESATDLVDRDVAAVVGHSSSAASLASAPVYNEHEVVQLSPQSSAAAYSDAGPYSFRLVPPDDRQGTYIAQTLRSMPDVRRIVVLYVNDDYGRGLRSTLLAALHGNAPEVVGEAPHLERTASRADDVDLARRVIAQTRPDAIVWLGRALILAEYLPMLRELGPMPVIGSDGVAAVRREEATPIWADVWHVDFVDPLSTDTLRAFARRFEAHVGRAAGSADLLTYDATLMLLRAAHDGARTGREIRAWLESLGRSRPAYQGITGPIRFDNDGDVDRTYVLRRVVPERAAAPAR